MNLKNRAIVYVARKFMNSYVKEYLNLKDDIKGLPHCKKDKKYLLYIHIPFCSVFCPYCSFNKFKYTKERAENYYKYLNEELLHLKELGYDFNYLVVGGGTPLINEKELIKCIELAKKLFSIEKVSCESDPNNIEKNVVENLKGLVDRLSVGVQTFDDDILRKVGRYEKFGSGKEIFKKVENILDILPTISIDLIFNFPNQSKQGLINDLDILKTLSPEQTSFYPLMKSFLVKNKIDKKLGVTKKSYEFEFYETIKNSLKDMYTSKQGWSFSKIKKDMIDEYVIENDEYIGIGSGSFSFINNTLYQNEFALDKYARLIKERKSATIKQREFPLKSIMYYKMMVDLFNGELVKEKFKTMFNKDIDKALAFELFLFKIFGCVKNNKEHIYSTDFGDYFFLVLMKDFYIGMDTIRDNARKNLNIC